MARVKFTILLDEVLHRRLKVAAAEDKKTMASVVEELVAEFLASRIGKAELSEWEVKE